MLRWSAGLASLNPYPLQRTPACLNCKHVSALAWLSPSIRRWALIERRVLNVCYQIRLISIKTLSVATFLVCFLMVLRGRGTLWGVTLRSSGCLSRTGRLLSLVHSQCGLPHFTQPCVCTRERSLPVRDKQPLD